MLEENNHQFESISGALSRMASVRGESVFLECGRSSAQFTFAAAEKTVDRLANSLHRQGVRRHDVLLMMGRNGIELILMFFAVARLGGISVILHEATSARNLEKVLEQTSPKAVFFGDECRARLGPAASQVENNHSLESFFARAARDTSPAFPRVLHCAIECDPVVLFFTSGSTGDPRGVVVTHRNMSFSMCAIQRRLRYQPTDRIGLFLPLSFDYGFYQVALALISGATVVIHSQDRVGPDLVFLLRTHSISVLPAVPTLVSALLLLSRRHGAPLLPCLRLVTNTGERLPSAHVDQVRKFFPGIDLCLMYGLTECKRVSILLPNEIDTKPGSVGRPLDGTEVFVVDEAGKRLDSNSIGELVIRGAHVCAGYWQDPGQTAERFHRDPRTGLVELRSGDLCSVDDEGYIYFHDRADRMLKHRGHRMNAVEIEEAACRIPGVAQAAVMRMPVDERLHLFIRRQDEELGVHQILGSLRASLEPFKVPDLVHFVQEFPKTNNGKLARREFEAMLEATGS